MSLSPPPPGRWRVQDLRRVPQEAGPGSPGSPRVFHFHFSLLNICVDLGLWPLSSGVSPRYTRKAPPGWKDTTPGSTHAGTRRISDSAQPHAGAHPTQPPRRLRVGAVTNERKDTPGATVTWPSTPLGAGRQHCIHLLQHYHDRPPLTPPPSWALLSILLETWPCSTRRDREACLVPISHSSLDLPLSPIGHCHCHSPK